MSVVLPQLTLPFSIRHYILTEVVGSGGFGMVYKAKSTSYQIDYDFAVKVMALPAEEDLTIKKRLLLFESEVNSLKQLDHPNVIRLYDYFIENNMVFMVLEYCPNGTLDDRINSLSPVECLCIMRDIVSGVKYCHGMSIAHRDIKASNILFDASNRIKIADFGLSRLMENQDEKLSNHQGSLFYLPPEVITKDKYAPLTADIWSLGVLLYKLFVKKLPFTGKTKEELMSNIKNCVYFPSKIPSNMSYLISKMLKVNPHERFTIGEVYNTVMQITMKKKLTALPSRVRKSQASLTLPHLPLYLDGQSNRRNVQLVDFASMSTHYATTDIVKANKLLNPRRDIKCMNKLGSLHTPGCSRSHVFL